MKPENELEAKKPTLTENFLPSDGAACSQSFCPNVGGWQICSKPAKLYVLKLDSLYHSKSGFKNHNIVAALCPKHAKEFKACFTPANVLAHPRREGSLKIKLDACRRRMERLVLLLVSFFRFDG
jgi:hypothetical protein